ncbi:hypothetical protein RJ639_019214 [Escallonia herrerae]|uniref:Uncharacterized protein n=1 Tax=Escallonia herrerae TaxID=1293975 RepID=A0AA88V8T5_9ASTE|nr:hypothetical protein RJ639_019214 [Escallonia herrerae]
MKASLIFRDEQKPLFRAKVPLNILGFPFQSGVVAGESKELSLNLGTFFDSGPSCKLAYRPNDPANPFSLVFKTGTGSLGSPVSSAMTMSAEFRLVGHQNPSFFVHFKPQFGDFTLKKSQSSVFPKGLKSDQNGGLLGDEDGSMEVVEAPLAGGGYEFFPGKRIAVLPPESHVQAAGMLKGFVSGMEVTARTAVPLRNRALVNFRWGVRVPPAAAAGKGNPTAGISFDKFPLLVMNKIGIEHVAKGDSKEPQVVGPGTNSALSSDVAGACLDLKRQMEAMQCENGMLRKAMDDLRAEFATVKSGSPAGRYREGGRHAGGDKKPAAESNGFGGKGEEGNAETKKAF